LKRPTWKWLCLLSGAMVLGTASLAVAGEGPGFRKIWDNVLLLLNFGVLVFLFVKFAQKPLLNFLHQEKDKVATALKSSEETLKDTTRQLADERDKLVHIAEQMERLHGELLEQAARDRDAIVAEAETKAQEITTRAEGEIEVRLAQARTALAEELAENVTTVVKDKMMLVMTEDQDAVLIEDFTSGLEDTRRMKSMLRAAEGVEGI